MSQAQARGPSNETPQIQDPRKFFIIYKRDTAGDLARFVHDGLHGRGVDTFLDVVDLKEGLTRPQWKKQRDEALDDSDVFIFIVTHSASSSDEIRHELKKALNKCNSDVRAFIDNEIWDADNELRISIDNRSINIKDFQCRRFQATEELLRKVTNSTLITKVIEPS